MPTNDLWSYLPGRSGGAGASAAGQRSPVHQPDVDLLRAGVPPQDTGSAAAVVVAQTVHDPGRGGVSDAAAAGHRGPVDEPDVDLPGAAVPPQDVTLAVTIEIADSSNAPVRGDITEAS